jgi:hypothetical protein
MKPTIRTLALIVPFAATGCLNERLAGTSTETENAVAARAFPVDSVLPTGTLPAKDPVVATLRLDSSKFDFQGTAKDGLALSVVGPDEKQIPFEVVYWDPAREKGRLRIRIDSNLRNPGSRIEVRSGAHPTNLASSRDVWAGIPSDRKLSWTSVLVDDFEGGSLLHNRLPNGSFWFQGGFLPASGLASNAGGRAGTSLHLACTIGQCDSSPGLLGATLLANTPRGFRSLDSLELWAKGSGRIWITLESLDSVQMGRMQRGHLDSIQTKRTWTSRGLDTSWHRFSIKPADFDAADGQSGNVGWGALRDSINYFTVLLEKGSDVWIDDIRLHGILPEDLR